MSRVAVMVVAGMSIAGASTAAWYYATPLAALPATAGALIALLLAIMQRPLPLTAPGSSGLRQIDDPDVLHARRVAIERELGHLQDGQELQRGVFDVSAELVGCVEEADARQRFAAALRRYWSCIATDLLIWERGAWRCLGGEAHGEPPTLSRPVLLPEDNDGDLVLDLSAAVSGQAAVVLRGAKAQPTLRGRNAHDQTSVAEVLRGQLALSLRRVMLYGELQALARSDPLTGTNRRWYGEKRLEELVESGAVVAVAMVDIDFFKKVNDGFGHSAGDAVLAAVGRCLASGLRTGDMVCRWGGEEFVVVLPDTSPSGAVQVANRLRSAVAALADLPVSITVSLGVACIHQDEAAGELIQRADAALYAAKQQGRNRAILAEDMSPGGTIRTTSRSGTSRSGRSAVVLK